MRSKMSLILAITSLGLFTFLSSTMAQVENEIHLVDILNDAQGWHIEPCPLPGYAEHTWRIRNFSADTVCARIMIMVDDKHQNLYTLAPADSIDHLIDQWDCGIAVFLGECPGETLLTMCDRPCGPSLSQWGVVGLILSLIVAAIWIMLKRKEQFV